MMKITSAALISLFSLCFLACESPGRVQFLEEGPKTTAATEAETYEVEWLVEQEEALGVADVTYSVKVVQENQIPVELDPHFNGQELTITLISQDLGTFNRFSPGSSDGTYLGQLSHLLPGRYHLFSEFRPRGGRAQRHHTTLDIPGSTVQFNRTLDTTWVFRGESFFIEMTPEPPKLQPGQTVQLVFSLRDLETRPIAQELVPLEGKTALLFVAPGGQTLTAHSLRSSALETTQGQEELSAAFTPSASGLHKIWLQFQWREQIYTADFWLNVPE